MDFKVRCRDCIIAKRGETTELRKGEWTVEEDSKLIDCISIHGPAQWSYLAHSAGLKRTGKSCRLRWLNYLRPGVKRGNFTLEEQILILELHSRWGNRWSKIAQGLPGRTDNEIKNYWRTRVQKLANQLNCDVNSTQFRDTLHHIWLPRLREQAQATTAGTTNSAAQSSSSMHVEPAIINMTTPTHHDHILIACYKNTSYGLSDSNCTKSESPEEEANYQVSPANSDCRSTNYGDHQVGDVLVSSSSGNYWWEMIQEEGPITTHTVADQVGAISDPAFAFPIGYNNYYSEVQLEEEAGYWCHVFEECNRWFGGDHGGGGDSFEHVNDDMNWLNYNDLIDHDF